MFKPDFGKSFFERNQRALVGFLNSRLGRWFFALAAVEFPEDAKVMRVGPNFVSYDWKLVRAWDWGERQGEWRTQKKTMVFTTPRFQHRLMSVYARAAALFGAGVMAKVMAGNPALALFPVIALTTDTFYPDGSPETTSQSAALLWTSASFPLGETWAAGYGATDVASGAATQQASYNVPMIEAAAASPNWRQMGWAAHLFDTAAAIGDTDTIDSGTHSTYIESKDSDNATFNQGLQSFGSSLASNTTVASGDYDQHGSTPYSDATDLGSVSGAAYLDLTLNAAGLAAVSKTGITKFALGMSGFVTNTEPTHSSLGLSQVTTSFARTTGTSQDPKLVVVHSVSGPAGALTLGTKFWG